MRAESRIALVLVVCLLGGLGFFVQQRLKSDTNEITDESLAQFLAADQSDSGSSNTDTSETQTVNTHPAQASSAQTPPAQNDEPPRDLFTSDEFATPRETTRTANTGSSAVSPNPWSQTPAQPTTPSDSRTGVATADHSEVFHNEPRQPSSSGSPAWSGAGVTQVSGTEQASPASNPFATPSRGESAEPASTPQAFAPRNLIVESDATMSSTTSPAGDVFLPTNGAPPAAESDPFANSSPWGSSPARQPAPVATAEGFPAPSATQRTAEPVFYQTPAPSVEAPGATQPMNQQPASPFDSPAAQTPPANTPPSDPFAPVPTNPSAPTGNAPAAAPTFNFGNPPATSQSPAPAQSTPAPSLTPTPSGNPFGNPSANATTGTAAQQPAYDPQGLSSAPGGDPGTRVYEVQPGDNYWTISRKVYGAGRYFSALAEYNRPRIENPDLLAPGMMVLVPTTEILDQRFDEIISGPSPNAVVEPAGFFVDAGGQPMYRVGDADTLSDISQRYLGRSSRWVQIYGLNRDVIENADALKPGTVLQLPPDAAPIALAPGESVIR